MNWQGLSTAALSLTVIGLFHPLVLAAYRHAGWPCWPLFLFSGLVLVTASLLFSGLLSTTLALLGSACLWSIWELRKLRRKEHTR